MKTTKLNKIIISLLCFAMVIAIVATSYASFKVNDAVNIDTSKDTQISNAGNSILGIIKIVGIIASVGCLMVLGVKYMMGSAEEKAEYKKSFIPYIIGAVLLFAAATFAQNIADWATGIFG